MRRHQELLQHYADAWDMFAGGTRAAAGASAAPSADGNALFAALPEEARTPLRDRPLSAPESTVNLRKTVLLPGGNATLYPLRSSARHVTL